MIKAYLFDAYGKTEYVADFLKYKELARILEVSYNKTVEEVEIGRSSCRERV